MKTRMMIAGLFCFLAPALAQYGGLTKKEVKRLAQETRKMAADFEHDFDRALDKSIVDNTKAEGRYNNRAEKIEDHLDRVEGTVGDPKKMAKHLEFALEAAFEVQKFLSEHRFPPQIDREWERLRGNLNELAGLAGLDPLKAP